MNTNKYQWYHKDQIFWCEQLELEGIPSLPVKDDVYVLLVGLGRCNDHCEVTTHEMLRCRGTQGPLVSGSPYAPTIG